MGAHSERLGDRSGLDTRDTRTWWDPSCRLLRAIRDYQRAGPLGRKWAAFRYRFWSVITGAEIDPCTDIGDGLMLPNPNGVVIHADVHIGPNCMIFQQVTLGNNRGRDGVPILGGHVDIRPGARVLGPVEIGDHAVVFCDVPAGTVAVGVPARILPGERRR